MTVIDYHNFVLDGGIDPFSLPAKKETILLTTFWPDSIEICGDISFPRTQLVGAKKNISINSQPQNPDLYFVN